MLINIVSAAPVPEPRVVTTDYHGTQIDDPYRHFEERGNAEVAAWARTLSDETFAKLAAIPERVRISKLIDEADQILGDSVGTIQQPVAGDYYFLMRRQGDAIELLFRQAPGGEPVLLLDPRTIEDGGGAPATISHFSLSPDRKYLAAGITAGGSENANLYVLDAATGAVLEGPFDRARWGPTQWLPDNSGFLYNRLQKLGPDADRQETFQRSIVFHHRLGTAEKEDRPVFGIGVNPGIEVKPQDLVFARPLGDSGWIVATSVTGVSADNIIHLARLDEALAGQAKWRLVAQRADLAGANRGGSLTRHGDHLYLLTRKDAPNGRIVRLSLKGDAFGEMETVFQAPSGAIQELAGNRDALYVRVLDGGPSRLFRLPWEALDQPQALEMPEEGRISLHGGIGAYATLPGVEFTLSSWTRPPRHYRIEAGGTCAELINLPQVAEPPISANLVSRQIKVRGHDGTLIPVSIVHRKDLPRDRTHPLMLIGYGSYGFSSEPNFSHSDAAFLEMGAIKAVAHVRGGGELGDKWRLAGFRETKPNTWKDMISAAEGLVAEGYTTPRQICIHGRSAGGITVGRAFAEKPEAFGAVLIGVGLLDTLRAETTPNGVPNVPEFGSVETKEGFEALLAMSAYHHLMDGGRYPSTLLYHGANDTRVELWQSLKMTARLQAVQESPDVLLRIDYNTGHGGGASRKQANDLHADVFAFFFSRCR
ncbi:MAG: S9 family peptidase [Burkholderiales bacterium]|nr:S9 family peptidase [Opitutaceae bacterium]